MQQFQMYDSPGNVRELQHVIERATITSTKGRLDIQLPNKEKARGSSEAALELVVRTDAQIRQMEADNIRAALRPRNTKSLAQEGQLSFSG
jgi:transcriptional regulator with PAS, ATPase and Fis domain